jgi:hypothetical protein
VKKGSPRTPFQKALLFSIYAIFSIMQSKRTPLSAFFRHFQKIPAVLRVYNIVFRASVSCFFTSPHSLRRASIRSFFRAFTFLKFFGKERWGNLLFTKGFPSVNPRFHYTPRFSPA